MKEEFDENEIRHDMCIHILWSTRKQQPLISPSIGQQLYNYMCDLVLPYECHVISGRVFSDHIQLVVKFSPNTVLSDLLTTLKVATMLWIRTHFPELENFQWQESDFLFSVSSEEVGSLIENIKNSKSFVEEVYSILDQNALEYDPEEVLE